MTRRRARIVASSPTASTRRPVRREDVRGEVFCRRIPAEVTRERLICTALYQPVRCHLEAVALLERQARGRAAEQEGMAAGGYCSKEDSPQHIGGFLLAGTMRMTTATSARISASPAALARARERA